MKTYYSDKFNDFKSYHTGMLLFLPDLKKELSQFISKDIAKLEPSFFAQLAMSYQFAYNNIYTEGLQIWRDVISIYYELINLNVQLNKAQEMYELCGIITIHLSEGLQELFYCEEQIKNNNSEETEVFLKLHLDKYHTLFESCLRYSITLGIWCLDNISGNKDINQNFEKLIKDDLSYKVKKIEECSNYQFINKLNSLKEGVDPLVRNSIAHKTFEYLENKKIKLIDRDRHKEFSLYELQTLIDKIKINYYAQLTVLNLFTFDNFDKIDISKVKKYSGNKQLRIIIDQEFRNFSFVPKSIEFINENIICKVEAPIGYNSTKEIMGNLGMGNFYSIIPPSNLSNSICNIIYHIAQLKTSYKNCKVIIFESHSKDTLGFIEVNLDEWTKLSDSNPTVEELNKYIINDSLPK